MAFVGLGKWGFIVEEVDYKNEHTVSAISIIDIMKKFNLDHIAILKVDIEGSEKELFESNIEEWLPKTKVIIIELHDRMKSGTSMSFFKALYNYDYSLSFKKGKIFSALLNKDNISFLVL